MTEYNMSEAVAKGVALLDLHLPGWAADTGRIDLDTLDLADNEDCVLGQLFPSTTDVFGGWGRGMRFLLGDTENATSSAHGFEVHQSALGGDWSERCEAYDSLTSAWRTVIEDRRAQADYVAPCPVEGCTLAVTRAGGLAPGGVCPTHGHQIPSVTA